MNKRASELILNSDGSIYHLNLLPQDLAETIILVGDPNRVKHVSAFFDSIEVKKEKREFVTHTGQRNGKRISVVSTGIGTDNIDIVLNELDALANIDLKTGLTKPTHTPLQFVRLGTSGALDPSIPIDSVVLSKAAIGFDSLFRFYAPNPAIRRQNNDKLSWYSCESPYLDYSPFTAMALVGKTATMPGFYAPQGRSLRLGLSLDVHALLHQHNVQNLEMETAGIYGLAHLMGHQALSLSAILANRALGRFSNKPKATVNAMIEDALTILCG